MLKSIFQFARDMIVRKRSSEQSSPAPVFDGDLSLMNEMVNMGRAGTPDEGKKDPFHIHIMGTDLSQLDQHPLSLEVEAQARKAFAPIVQALNNGVNSAEERRRFYFFATPYDGSDPFERITTFFEAPDESEKSGDSLNEDQWVVKCSVGYLTENERVASLYFDRADRIVYSEDTLDALRAPDGTIITRDSLKDNSFDFSIPVAQSINLESLVFSMSDEGPQYGELQTIVRMLGERFNPHNRLNILVVQDEAKRPPLCLGVKPSEAPSVKA